MATTKQFKIYTKTGDKGTTGFIGGRISKSSNLIEVIGNLDELNACIGITIAMMFANISFPMGRGTRQRAGGGGSNLEYESDRLINIQNTTFNLGAIISGSNQKFVIDTKGLENDIDEWDKILEPLQNFILPGGSLAASQIHLARAVCRRAERSYIKFLENGTVGDGHRPSQNLQFDNSKNEILKYLNRLSDWLFTLARVLNKKLEVSDRLWEK